MPNDLLTRRNLLKGAAAAGFPAIVPASVFGQAAPSNRVSIGQIGIGRIARGHDIPETLKHVRAQVAAVSDLDAKRLVLGRQFVDEEQTKRAGRPYSGTRGYADYREMLARDDIDAVIISTPDHQHAVPAIHAVRAGKDVYLQKPTSITIAEGRLLADEVKRSGRIVQVGSQQRSLNPWPQFHRACELVRNGRIGKLIHVEVGLPGDPSGPEAPPQPVPPNLDYDAWLGTTPEVYYTEIRVHPQADFGRPGWLRCEQFGAGMITGWGSHHVDTAHWGMGTELTGPVEIWGEAEFPKSGLWDVHGAFRTNARYANGVTMAISGEFPNGVKFVGSDGWIFVSRSAPVTSSDPGGTPKTPPLAASDPKILESVIGPNEVRLYRSEEQHRNWVDSILTRRPNSTPIEIAHRSCSACLLHHAAMKTGRRLRWNPAAERFIDDAEADRLLSRPWRSGHGLS